MTKESFEFTSEMLQTFTSPLKKPLHEKVSNHLHNMMQMGEESWLDEPHQARSMYKSLGSVHHYIAGLHEQLGNKEAADHHRKNARLYLNMARGEQGDNP